MTALRIQQHTARSVGTRPDTERNLSLIFADAEKATRDCPCAPTTGSNGRQNVTLDSHTFEGESFRVRCTNCGTELIPGKRFCHVCGTAVVITCARCGAVLQPEFRFCPDCGWRVSAGDEPEASPESVPSNGDQLARLKRHVPENLAQKIRASTGVVAGERKLVTVLFCDLAGSTAIAERLDPEDYHDLLEAYLEVTFREIYRFEGIVNQLAGDGLMALFGAPIAHEDAPERAVEAAVAIRAALESLNETLAETGRPALRARIGIHTGPVVVGTVGNDLKMDYTAVGDTTNLAARLESLAEPGTILISEATQRLVRGRFEMRPLGPFDVKGKTEPVPAYEVVGRSAAATPMALAVERGLTLLVGRDEELSQLTACYARLGGGLAQVVAVVGEAGSGKSRLVYEFKRALEDEAVAFFEARCSSLSHDLPYGVWINMLRQYFDILSGESPSCACDRVAAKLEAEDEHLADIGPYLCRLLVTPADGIDETPIDELKQKTFEAVSRLVVAVSRRVPVLMLIEDLQWMDEPSREMLDLAVARLNGRMMLLVSHRPEFQPAWRTHAALTQLNLGPLSNEEATQIVRALAGGPLPAELEERILVKAEGNPFITEEITRALIEEGFLRPVDGQMALNRPLAEIRIPDTVHELIGARLDRLSPQAKRVVQVAAVFGRQFHSRDLSEMLNGEGIDVPAELQEIETRGIIHRKSMLSRDEFRFGESLTQEVAYDTLLFKDRRQLHGRIGTLVEAQAGDESPERSALLAHHFARGDDPVKAVRALMRAGHDAEQLPSFGTAVAFYRQAWAAADAALDTTNSDPALQGLAMEAAHSLCRLVVMYDSPDRGEFERAARRGRALAEALGDTATAAGFCAYHGMLMGNDRERFAQGLTLIEEGLTMVRRAGLELSTISISRALAWAYTCDGRFDLALRTFDWVVGELERRSDPTRPPDMYMSSRWMRDATRYLSDDVHGAVQSLTETYELAVRAPNRTIQSTSAATLAQAAHVCGQYAEAKRWADRGLELAQAIGSVGALRTASALALAARVDLGEPVNFARYAAAIEQGIAAGGTLLFNIRVITQSLLTLGDLARAEDLARLAYQRAAGRLREMLSMSALGDVMLRRGSSSWDEAEQWYQRAGALAETLKLRSTLAAVALGLGELLALRGDRAGGTARIRQALAMYRDLGFGHHQRRAEHLLASFDAPLAVDATAP